MDGDNGSGMEIEAQVPMRTDDEKALLILRQTIATLEEQYQRVRSWFDLVPDEYKATVRALAEDNFPFFREKFANDSQRFLEKMSKNWLMKFFAFESLAKESGFAPAPNGYVARGERIDSAGIVCLTRNGSYVLMGPGSCGTGAAMKYARVPFRNNGLNEEEIFTGGVILEDDVARGNRLYTSELSSSPLISLFTKQFEDEERGSIPEVMRDIGTRTAKCFIHINHETLEQ